MTMPVCPQQLPPDLLDLIDQFGREWSKSALRPTPKPEISAHWMDLLSEWIATTDLPIFVRKHENNRGSEIIHETGRVIVPTDNSLAHWDYVMACRDERPSLIDIRNMLNRDLLPVAMIQKTVEKPGARYHCTLRKEFNVNTYGWKLAHIQPVGLNTRTPIATLPIEKLTKQFQNLLAPSNMFVVPLAWAGLAEIDTVIQAIAKAPA